MLIATLIWSCSFSGCPLRAGITYFFAGSLLSSVSELKSESVESSDTSVSDDRISATSSSSDANSSGTGKP